MSVQSITPGRVPILLTKVEPEDGRLCCKAFCRCESKSSCPQPTPSPSRSRCRPYRGRPNDLSSEAACFGAGGP